VLVANVVANEQTTALYNYVGGTLNDQLGPWVLGTHMDGGIERNIFFHWLEIFRGGFIEHLNSDFSRMKN
jgi:hypothetical protein